MKSQNIFISFFLCISECVFGTGQMKATVHNVKWTSAQNMVARYVAKLCFDVVIMLRQHKSSNVLI